MLVASLTNLEDLDRVGDLADLIELRLDHFSTPKMADKPSIFTLRKKEQGGVRDISESERLAEIERLLQFQPDYLDIEADTDPSFIERIAQKFPRIKLIGSYHNFQETPQDLDALLESMRNPHFAIYKIAVTAKSTPDMLRLMIFAKRVKVPLTAMSMGEYGRPSRILGPIIGNALDYAGLTDDPNLHRYSLQTLHEVFRYRKLDRDTKIYALIGDPVEQSPGHFFHNSRFSDNAVYIKMRVRPEELAEFFKLIKQLPFHGFSVTIPLKEAIISYLDQVEGSIGAVNTIAIRDGKLIGSNTDGAGALNAIEKHVKVVRKRLAILGAGGTARAIAYEAKLRGASVTIYNRTPERAYQLALEFGCEGLGLDRVKPYDILVNTIPEGPLEMVQPNTVVMDVVYHPRETPLLAMAKKLDCQCIYGEEMFVEQANLQRLSWHYTDKNVYWMRY